MSFHSPISAQCLLLKVLHWCQRFLEAVTYLRLRLRLSPFGIGNGKRGHPFGKRSVGGRWERPSCP